MVVTLVAAAAALLFVPESPVRTPARLPVAPRRAAGRLAGRAADRAERGQRLGLDAHPPVLGLFALAVVLAAAWVAVELRVPVPMIDMHMMRRRGVWTSNVVAGCVGFGMFASFGFLPQLLQTPPEAGYGFGASITESGRLLLPSAVASFLVGFTTATLIRWVGARAVITTGLLLTGAAFVCVGLFHDQTWQLYAATTVQGVGSGLVFSSLAGVVVALGARRADRGGERHERQHPHHRRLDRRRGDGRDHHRAHHDAAATRPSVATRSASSCWAW